MLTWIKSLWPFVLRKTLRAVLEHSEARENYWQAKADRLVADAQRERRERDLADDQSRTACYLTTRLRLIVGEMLAVWPEYGPQFRDPEEAEFIVQEVDRLIPSFRVVAYSRPVVKIDAPSPTRIHSETTEMLKFSMTFGMSRDVPPELIANGMAEHAREAVLEHFKSQRVVKPR